MTTLARLKTLFVQFLQAAEVDRLSFCFFGVIFPHHTTVPFPNHESAETKEASVSLSRPVELSDEKLSNPIFWPKEHLALVCCDHLT